MPVSGLVVSLKNDPRLRAEAINAIRCESSIEVGVIAGRRMAIVVDTNSSDDDKRIWCWLGSLPGVAFVDVAMVGYEDEDAGQQAGADDEPAPASPPCNDIKYV
jgi:hypothetical protein